MWLIVGLGNPGSNYAGTRHNVGFDVLDLLSQRYSFPPWKSFLKADVARGKIAGVDVMLCKPKTFMNLSGDAVGPISRYYDDVTQIVVVHDELDFEPGIVRVKQSGGHGGHNGLRSLIQHVGAEFVRVRIGIGKPLGNEDAAGFVLSRIDAKSQPLMRSAFDEAADAVTEIVTLGVASAMRHHNVRDVL